VITSGYAYPTNGLEIRESRSISPRNKRKPAPPEDAVIIGIWLQFCYSFWKMLVGTTAEMRQDGSPTRARTWDLRINRPLIPRSTKIINQAFMLFLIGSGFWYLLISH
jgi:hypothetical protein